MGGLDYLLGKIFFSERMVRHWNSCPGLWWSQHRWKCSKDIWMWHLGTRFCDEHGDDGLRIVLFNHNDSMICCFYVCDCPKQSWGTKRLKDLKKSTPAIFLAQHKLLSLSWEKATGEIGRGYFQISSLSVPSDAGDKPGSPKKWNREKGLRV